VASQQLVVLSGRGGPNGAIGVRNGKVTLDIAPLEAVAKQDLVARGADDRRQDPHRSCHVRAVPIQNLAKAQKAYRLVNDLKIVLPILTLVLLGLGVLTARGHRRALIGAGLGFAASMLVLGVGLAIARAVYLNSVPASASTDAAAAALDILVRFIRTALRTLLVVGLIVAVGAFFTGPSAAAAATRSAFSSGLGRLRRAGESTGPVGRWTYSCRHALRIEAVALAALIFAFWGHPTAAVTIVIAVLLLIGLGLIELIGGRCWGTSAAIGRAPRARPVVAERLPVAFRRGRPALTGWGRPRAPPAGQTQAGASLRCARYTPPGPL
jgi:hypothetical protein